MFQVGIVAYGFALLVFWAAQATANVVTGRCNRELY